MIVDTVIKYALGGATVALAAYVGYLQLWDIPAIERERDKAVNDRKEFKEEHDRMVTENTKALAKLTGQYRDYEQQASATIEGLLLKGKKDAETIAASRRDLAESRRVRDDAQARYLAAVAAAAAADPGSSCRRYAAAAELLGKLHAETDRVAEEAAGAADAAAAQVIRLQAYVTNVCLKPLPGAVASQP